MVQRYVIVVVHGINDVVLVVAVPGAHAGDGLVSRCGGLGCIVSVAGWMLGTR